MRGSIIASRVPPENKIYINTIHNTKNSKKKKTPNQPDLNTYSIPNAEKIFKNEERLVNTKIKNVHNKIFK